MHPTVLLTRIEVPTDYELQCTLDCLCGDYPVCKLSMPDCKLLTTKDKGGK